MRRRARAVVALAGAALAMALAGCSRASDLPPIPEPPSTVEPTSTTAPIDYSRVPLPAVAGRTTTSADNTVGQGVIEGVVVGPDGPVEGALVRVERFAPAQEIRTDLATGPGGTFQLLGAKGGRYRVRAWRVPDLVALPQVFFLGITDRVKLQFKMEPRVGTSVSADIAPDRPEVGDPAELLVLVTTRSVDENGVVQGVPVGNAVVGLTGSGAWRVLGPNPVFTDPRGRSSFLVTCNAPGPQPLTVVVNGAESFPLSLPPCRLPPTTTLATTPAGPSGPPTTVRRTAPTTPR